MIISHCHIEQTEPFLFHSCFVITKQKGLSRVVYDVHFFAGSLNVCFTDDIALSRRSSKMVGFNSTMSKLVNVQFSFISTDLNHSITAAEFFQSVTSDFSLSLPFMLSRICLLINPISLFAGLMSLHGRLFLKFSLSSFSVMNTSLLPSHQFYQQCQVCWRWLVPSHWSYYKRLHFRTYSALLYSLVLASRVVFFSQPVKVSGFVSWHEAIVDTNNTPRWKHTWVRQRHLLNNDSWTT